MTSSRKLLAIAALVYAYFIGGFVNNPMTNSIGDLTLALVDDHTVRVDPYYSNSVDLSKRDGISYSGMPPGLSFALVPVYLVMKPPLAVVGADRIERANAYLERSIQAKFPGSPPSKNRAVLALLLATGTLFLGIPLALLMGRAFVRVATGLGLAGDREAAALLGFLLFCTGVADFSSTLYHTTVAAALLFLAFADSALRWRQPRSPGRLAATGFALGMVAAIDYPALVYSGLIGAFVLASLPRRTIPGLLALGAGFLLPVALMLAYHKAAFGSAFTSAYQWRDIDRNYLYRAIVEELSRGPTAYFPTVNKVLRGLFSPQCGILIHNPILLPGIVAAIAGWVGGQRRAFHLALVAVLLANLGYYLSLPEAIAPHIGSFGARYTVYSTPFALLALAPWLARAIARGWGRVLTGLAILAAIPVWLYLFYGSPVRSLSEYATLLADIGPSNYVLMKLHDAGQVASAWPSYLGLAALAGACLVVASRDRA